MDEDLQNANPTILSASDLPSRSHPTTTKPRSDGGTGLFDGLLPRSPYTSDLLSPAHTFGGASPDASSSEGGDNGVDDGEGGDDDDDDDSIVEEIDAQEVYDLIKNISDPEHPLSLGSLSVVNLPDIKITPPTSTASQISTVEVLITPTITHCSLATVIGLGVRVRLEQALPPRFRVDVKIKQGTHSTAEAVTKQLGDKERVAAALENETLMGVLRKMLATC